MLNKSKYLNPKKREIKFMFNEISKFYDIMNFIMTLGVDKLWRKKIAKKLDNIKNGKILDIATGTGDLAIELKKKCSNKIYGIDVSEKMIEIANKKIRKSGFENIKLYVGDSQKMPFQNNFFDAVTISFGVRNFENLNKCLSEIKRVLKKNGKLIILETSVPQSKFLKFFYKIYFNLIISISFLISKKTYAYKYLYNSASIFPFGEAFKKILINNGFKVISNEKQLFGVAMIYSALKQ
tara:strand:+ start:35709 stop:36422 length:714 start_codon:yes stop_codon:yes gene_type:complete